MTNPTPEAIEALRDQLLLRILGVEAERCDDFEDAQFTGERPDLADYEVTMPLQFATSVYDMLTALAQPDPTGGWCSDMEAVPYDEVVRRQEKDATP